MPFKFGAYAMMSSGVLAGASTIKATSGHVGAVMLLTDGTNDCTCELRDGGASGTIKIKVVCLGASKGLCWSFPPVPFGTNIYNAAPGTNAELIVLYV